MTDDDDFPTIKLGKGGKLYAGRPNCRIFIVKHYENKTVQEYEA